MFDILTPYYTNNVKPNSDNELERSVWRIILKWDCYQRDRPSHGKRPKVMLNMWGSME